MTAKEQKAFMELGQTLGYENEAKKAKIEADRETEKAKIEAAKIEAEKRTAENERLKIEADREAE